MGVVTASQSDSSVMATQIVWTSQMRQPVVSILPTNGFLCSTLDTKTHTKKLYTCICFLLNSPSQGFLAGGRRPLGGLHRYCRELITFVQLDILYFLYSILNIEHCMLFKYLNILEKQVTLTHHLAQLIIRNHFIL